ncbi:MAG: CCA tRNA nucleotidyltransferase [Hyphomicrobiales bacterium]|nr:CCA tRNA nucleotidyltransferase [Hyphomicrobiales bacterium]MCP5371060.1 CCA tRNA nucleotidyltransferase [Hyphomicrobiales bacterium]
MTAPPTRRVLDALTADGGEARFIGGCVRDALLKRPIRDIDIATPQTPQTVIALMDRAGIKTVPTGIDHGTVTAVCNGVPFEITTLRVDVETDGRRARVAFTDDWEADAARRDFTINAFSCTADGDVYDFFGGLDDLGQGRVRFVGNARARIEEDVLRLLRFFRFYATYGQPPPDPDALAACRAMAAKLPLLSGERVRVEIFRTLMAPDPADVMGLMRGEQVLDHVLPEAGDVGRLRLMSWLDTRAVKMDSVAPHPVRRLGALVRTDAAGAEDIAARMKMATRQKRRLVLLAQPPADLDPDMGAPALRRALHRHGAPAVTDMALLAWAGELAVTARPPAGRNQAWIALLEAASAWTDVAFPLRGRDALALGMAPDRRMGQVLKQVEAWWEDEDYAPDRAACLARLADLIGAPAPPPEPEQETRP